MMGNAAALIEAETFTREEGGTLTCELGASNGGYRVSLRLDLDVTGAAVEMFQDAQQARARHAAVVRQLRAAGWVARPQ